MEEGNKNVLASCKDYASVHTCECCNHEVIHINFYNLTMRLPRKQMKDFVGMLNAAMLKIDESGEFSQTMEGVFNFHNYLDRCES